MKRLIALAVLGGFLAALGLGCCGEPTKPAAPPPGAPGQGPERGTGKAPP